jgi:hypothetical protein
MMSARARRGNIGVDPALPGVDPIHDAGAMIPERGFAQVARDRRGFDDIHGHVFTRLSIW